MQKQKHGWSNISKKQAAGEKTLLQTKSQKIGFENEKQLSGKSVRTPPPLL